MELAIQNALQYLGYKEIRNHQSEIIRAYLQGHDALLCSPTGSGKSLTFEIAPFVFNEMTNTNKCTVVVVSPLVALMQFQVETLSKKGIQALYLQDTNQSIEELCSGTVQIIFASPESLLNEKRQLLRELSKTDVLKAIFIDEAHCIKKFGKGNAKRKIPAFRPVYGQLGELRSLVNKKVPVIALTATADFPTRDLILNTLCMPNAKQVILTPEKKNVKYSVEIGHKDIISNFTWLLDLLVHYKARCPRIIIFFRQIKYISEVFELLQTNLGEDQYVNKTNEKGNGYWNRLFAMFHLMTNEDIKKTVCSNFRDVDGCIRVVLCSTSFSMRLDVKNVHTVVHYGPANDVDDYLQESGRAGRDRDAQCNAILIKYKYFLSSQNVSPQMKSYVNLKTCRRVQLLTPFASNTVSLKPNHNCCDICSLTCKCRCMCTNVCSCEAECAAFESELLGRIRTALSKQNADTSSSSSSEGFSSDSDFERYLSRQPVLVSNSSDSN